MSETTSKWQSDVYGVMPSKYNTALFLLQTESGWQLPHVTFNKEIWIHRAGDIAEAMHALLGQAVFVLRDLRYQHERHTTAEVGYHLLELLGDPHGLPANGRYHPMADLPHLTFAFPEQREVVLRYAHETAVGFVAARCPPWAFAGWFDAAAPWIEAELRRNGRSLTGPIAQVKSWCLSSVLRVPTDQGPAYFKTPAALPLFVNETAVVSALAARWPEHIPAILGADPARDWLLLADSGPTDPWEIRPADWQERLLQFGKLQTATATNPAWVLEAGGLDRRLPVLQSQLAPLLADDFVLQRMTAEEITQVRQLAPRLEAMIQQLAALPIPATLVHGDLHPGNVTYDGLNTRFIDWTDACLAHPFFDMHFICEQEDQAAWQPARDAYLALWLDYAPMSDLLQAWDLARPSALLHQAVSYQHIVRFIEAGQESKFLGAVAHYLNLLCQTVATS